MFTHLRVASGYSFQYGASHPGQLVARAVELGMDTLAITDRDGLYGAVRFAKHCLAAGLWPVIGVDLALGGTGPSLRLATPARGGQQRDPKLPRVVALATSRAGWATLCKLTSHAHAGRPRTPAVTVEVIAEICAGQDVVLLLGADSDVGELLASRRIDLAERRLAQWWRLLGEGVRLAATNHRVGGCGVASAHQAAGLIRLAERTGVSCVITNMVRMARPQQAATVDVLDAARRMMPLDERNLDRRNCEGYLKDEAAMREAIREAAQLAGVAETKLLAATRELAERARLHPVADIGLGEVKLPEFGLLGTSADLAPGLLRQRCETGALQRYGALTPALRVRLAEELAVIRELKFESYFLTVAEITDAIRQRGIRCAARGSGAGSLVNYTLGISGVDPLAHDLLLSRFLSPKRRALPDIDLDVESARRAEVYELILDRFGAERVSSVAMLETYRVRQAVRDVGAALSLPPGEIDAMAKAFPHIRARDARAALAELPELRAAGLGQERLDGLFRLVESLDGLPRHIALHPCGVLLSDSTLRERTPLEPSATGFPMSQFDKDDVEELGFLKLDVLGVRMQSALSHALGELERVAGQAPDIDSLAPFNDPGVYEMIGNRQTLGCFQIESPGQRELVGKFGPENFADLIIDISLFRPGPVKTDMVTPFLEARQGWREPRYLHPRFKPVLKPTFGVVIFHEQIIQLISLATGCSQADGDEARRELGDRSGQERVREWFIPKALETGLSRAVIEELWGILVGFASFGFCKAHAVAFALPTYQSAWLKFHHPAAFLAGVLTHDPGMYPKRLLLEEARRFGVSVLGLDVNLSDGCYRVERTASGWGIRLSLADVSGISETEISAITKAQPFQGITDFYHRSGASRPVTESLVLAGAFDALHGIGDGAHVRSRKQLTRRDLLLAVADLYRLVEPQGTSQPGFDFGPEAELVPSGLPELGPEERITAELEVLGLDASGHLLGRYLPMLAALGVIPASDLLGQRNRSCVLVAGVKVATQTPAVRSGKRVIFLTLDDSTGPVDVTFFEDSQGSAAATVFNSWLLLVRGITRRTGPRGISIRAMGAWELGQVFELWEQTRRAAGLDQARRVVSELLAEISQGAAADSDSRSALEQLPLAGEQSPPEPQHSSLGTVVRAPRKLWHSSPGSAGR